MSELRFESLVCPAADLGAENPLPPIARRSDLHSIAAAEDIPADLRANLAYGHVPNIMPYSLQDGYDRDLVNRPLPVAVLENDILRATFLLTLGGRLWSLYHKPAQRELLYCNPVFQPANLALRNAWFCGGVEWNIGTTGHSPFTCAPLFAARVISPDGLPILRMYEWERMRQVPFQIDTWLPDGSAVLFVQVSILNPHPYTTPMYWWSNMAVPEGPGRRVVVPAPAAFSFGYQRGRLRRVPTPLVDGLDTTYTLNLNHAADFFFEIPSGSRRWITSLDPVGSGLVQVSTDLLAGRKLFVWGSGAGGRKWQRFLSPQGGEYLEIQAGLARTQMEHLPMPPGDRWTWLEAYGLLQADPAEIHQEHWQRAIQSAEKALESLLPRRLIETQFERSCDWIDLPPQQVVQRGSGWGALERLRRQSAGEAPVDTPGLIFDDASLGEEQAAWLAVLQVGRFPQVSPHSPPRGWLVQNEWRVQLESIAVEQAHNWAVWLHLGIMRYQAGEVESARQAWQRSLTCTTTPWALRCLAVLEGQEGNPILAAEYLLEARRSAPHVPALAVECGRALLAAGQAVQWLALLPELPEDVRTNGRVRLLAAQAALLAGQYPLLEQFFSQPFVLPDLREGETSLSDLWFEYHEQRLSAQENLSVDEELRQRVRRDFPLPAHLDFRMSAKK